MLEYCEACHYDCLELFAVINKDDYCYETAEY